MRAHRLARCVTSVFRARATWGDDGNSTNKIWGYDGDNSRDTLLSYVILSYIYIQPT